MNKPMKVAHGHGYHGHCVRGPCFATKGKITEISEVHLAPNVHCRLD